jgi:hypothetical protein
MPFGYEHHEDAARVLDEIRSFASLPVGWDYGNGGPIPEYAINKALYWAELFSLKGLDINAGPGTDGEVAVSGKLGDSRIEIVIEPDDTITVIFDFKGTRVSYEPRVPIQEAQDRILKHVGEAWNAFVYSMAENSIENQTSGWIRPLETRLVMDLYQFWRPNVYVVKSEQSVSTFANTGLEHQGSLESR